MVHNRCCSPTQFGTGLKLQKKNFGPYKITQAKGNDRYNVQKIGIHDGPHKTSSNAENITPWPNCEEQPIIAMMRFNKSFEKKQINIVIEGNIGAGKTTLLKYFNEQDELGFSISIVCVIDYAAKSQKLTNESKSWKGHTLVRRFSPKQITKLEQSILHSII